MEKLVKGPVVLYEQMRLKILELINQRNLKAHDPIPSETELAKLFGVSTRTSKEALIALAKEGIVYRMPRRGTFLAETNASKKRISLGIIVPEMDEYSGKLIEAAVQYAAANGAEALLRISGGILQTEESLLQELVHQGVNGIILFPGNRKSCGNEVLRLHLDNYPIVIVDRTYREINIPSVYHDHYQGGYDMTAYLLGQGHRRIGFVTEDIEGVMSREDRYYGYVQALMDHGIPVPRDLVYTHKAGQSGLAEFLSGHSEMTAVFCANDYLAGETEKACIQSGVKVPEQLSVTGFTDSPIASLLPVPLTTVRKPGVELGEAAARLLLERIRHSGTIPPSVKLPTELVIRESVRDMNQ